MPDIDELSIQIDANARSASSSIDKLVSGLTKLSSSVSSLGGRLSTVANGLQEISTASSSLSSRNITTLATSLGKISNVDYTGIRNVTSALKELADGFSFNGTTDISGITNIAVSLSKLGGSNATQGTQNLLAMKDQLKQFVEGMNSVSGLTFDASSLTGTINAISNLGGAKATQAVANLPTISAQLSQFVSKMNQIGSLSFDMSNLSELVTAISKLGSVASGRAVSTIPQLADALNQLFTTLSKAPNVSANIIEMTNAIAKLAQTGTSGARMATSLSSGLTSFTKISASAKKSAFSLASAFGKLYASYWLIIRGVSGLKKAINISSDLTEVENVVRQTFGNYENLIQDFASTSIQDYGMSELTAKETASRFQAMGTAMGFAQGEMADMSISLTALTGDLASFYNEEQDVVAKKLQSIFTGETEPLRAYGIDLTNATLKSYALANGLDADISSMTQAEKAMLRYQYVLQATSAASGDFARTSDTWANQVKILKQSFESLAGIIGGTLINAFKPFIRTLNNVLKYVISFVETVTNALGAIFGWKYEVSAGGVADDWSSAADAADDVASGSGKAADNAKKIKTYLHDLDELNVFEPDDDTGDSGSGSGGSGSGGGGGSASGGLVQVDTIFKDYESQIENLYQLGEYIRDALIGAMESIDWNSVYEKARNFGKGLADFLNGLFAGSNGITLFGEVGKTIASALNTVIYAALSFGENFDFHQFGVNIADGINRFFSTFDFSSLAETLNTWVDGIVDAIDGAIETIDWSEVVSGIGDFLSNLEVDTIAVIAGTLVLKEVGTVSIGAAIKKAISNTFNKVFGISLAAAGKNVVKTIGTTISGWISAGIASLNVSGFISSLSNVFSMISPGMLGQAFVTFEQFTIGTWLDTNTWSGIPKLINDTINSLIDLIGSLLNAGVVAIGQALKTALSSIFNWDDTAAIFESAKENFKQGGLNIILGIVEGIAGGITFLLEPITNIFTTLWDALCDVFGIHSPAETMKPIGQNILLGIVEGFTSMISSFINAIVEWKNQVLTFITTQVPEIPTKILEFFQDLPANVIAFFTQILTDIGTWVADSVAYVTEHVPEIANKIVAIFEEIPDKIVTVGENIIKGLWSGITDTWETLKSGAAEFCENFIGQFRLGFDINSPSKKMEEVGSYALQGLALPFTDASTFQEQIAVFVQSVLSTFQTMFSYENFLLMGQNATAALAEGFNIGFQNMQVNATAIVTTLVNNIVTKFTTMKTQVTTIVTTLYNMLSTKWNQILTLTTSKWTEIMNLNTKNWTELLTANTNNMTTLNNVLTAGMDVANLNWSNQWAKFVTKVHDACAEVVSAVQSLQSQVQSMCDAMMAAINAVKSAAAGLGGISVGGVRGFAAGGFPESGELYMARENGASEMVGSFGTRTAVANNDQIVAGISVGVQNAVATALAPYLATIVQNTGVIASKDVSLEIDGREMLKALSDRSSRNGFSFT